MNIVYANTSSVIQLGRQGEHQATQVVFDLSDWLREYGSGTADLIYQRSGDESPYPIAAEHTAETLIWTVSYVDTAIPDYGRCEIQYRVNDTLVKSRIWMTYVSKAMDGDISPEPPESERTWLDQVLETGASCADAETAAKAAAIAAAEAAKRAEAAIVHSPYPSPSTGTWWLWDAEKGDYVDSGQPTSSDGGDIDHARLTGRDAADQHPIESIIDLRSELKSCVKTYDTISAIEIIKLTEG